MYEVLSDVNLQTTHSSHRIWKCSSLVMYTFPCFVGTDKERGLHVWKEQMSRQEETSNNNQCCYDLPWVGKLLNGWTWTRFIPICPRFKGYTCSRK